MTKILPRFLPAIMATALLLLSFAPPLMAQTEVSYQRGATQLEDVLPPSPEASSRVKYADVPFTHSTGAAEYSVPIWELKGRRLTIPISLDYCSNGIRMDEIAGGALTLEGAPFDGGRLTEAGARYQVTDHLGSVRAVWDGTVSATSYPLAGFFSMDDYAPYGVKSASGAAAIITLKPTGATVSLRDGFTGQEDQGPDFSVPYLDFGARQYSPSLSRWLVPNPMGEKYYDVSPYAYCAGNPVSLVDPKGDTLAVMIAAHGAAGFGHIAVAVQDNDGVYRLYSKNGYDEGGKQETKSIVGRFRGSNSDKGTMLDEGIMSFLLSSSSNSVKNDHSDYPYYTEALLVPTTKEQDDSITDSAHKAISRPYNFLFDNCAHTVFQSLSEAGVPTITSNLPSQVAGAPMSLYMKMTIPKLLYQEIKHSNPKGLIIRPTIK